MSLQGAVSSGAPGRRAPAVPPLGRLWPPMLGLALLAHGALAIAMMQPGATQVQAGGGGEVLGRVSISLAAATATERATETEKATATATATATETETEDAPEEESVRHESVTPPATPPVMPPVAPRAIQSVTPPPVERTAPAAAATSVAPPSPAARPDMTASRDVRRDEETASAQASERMGAQMPGVGASAPSAGGGGGDRLDQAEMDAYLARLRQMIEAERTYPRSARRQRLEGTAVIDLAIRGDGTVSRLVVQRSSGVRSLDQAAERMVRAAQPFPAPPEGAFAVVLPIAFALEQ